MTTALDLIKSAMRKAGVTSKGETPSAEETGDALASLNAMLESWATDGLAVPSRTTDTLVLTAGTGTYTIGSGGAINTVRPAQIISAFTRSGTEDTPLTIITDDDYAAIATKSDTGTPEFLNYSNAYPLGTINLYPVPSAADTLYLLSEKKLTSYSLTDAVALQEGWERAIVYNLAVEIAPEYGVAIPQETAAIAATSLANIKKAVARQRPLDAQPTANTRNIFIGYR